MTNAMPGSHIVRKCEWRISTRSNPTGNPCPWTARYRVLAQPGLLACGTHANAAARLPDVTVERLRDDGERPTGTASVHTDPNACYVWPGRHGAGGYVRIRYNADQSVPLHRLIWEASNGPVPPGMDVCHGCDNPPCYRLSHLFVGTRAENNADKATKGRAHSPAGELNGSSRLSEADVRDIRRLYDFEGLSQAAIGAQFGITQVHVSSIVRRKSWAHL